MSKHEHLGKPWPKRKLPLEPEMLMTLMHFQLGLINEHLAFQFDVSEEESQPSIRQVTTDRTIKKTLVTKVKVPVIELSCLFAF